MKMEILRMDKLMYSQLAAELSPVAPELFYFPIPIYIVEFAPEVGPH